jgi:hypothetical protein
MNSEYDFWLKVAGASFGLWAVMIPIGISMIRSSFNHSSMTQERFLKDFHDYVIQMERRVTTLEADVKRMNGG